jgi:thiol-disulfide isomerase/thioredoxin
LALACLSGGIKAGTPAPLPPSGDSPEIRDAQDAARRVRSLYFSEDYTAGAAEGEKLIERFPDSSELRAWALLNRAQQRMVGDAIREATVLTVERPSDPWSWFALTAASRFSPERRSETLKLSRKALDLAPDHPDFLWLRASALLDGRKPAKAIEFVEQALPGVPNPADLLTVRGDAILDVDGSDRKHVKPITLDAALQDYEKARRADSSCVRAYTHAATALAYSGHKPQEALPLIEQAAQIAPCSLGVHQSLWGILRLNREMNEEEKQARLQSDLQALLSCRGGLSVEDLSEKGLRELYIKVNGSDAGYERFQAQSQKAGAEERKSKILAGQLADPQPLEPFELKNLAGKRVSSAEMSGKILVVNFWGLWCGPCVEEMPDIQRLHEKYRNDPQVLILTIDNDEDPASVQEWMNERGYDFPVLLNDGYVEKTGIAAFPTTWFVDTRGRTAFVLADWSKRLVEEYSWRIEALRNDGS